MFGVDQDEFDDPFEEVPDGLPETPVDSIATTVTPSSVSQSAISSRALVSVRKVRTSERTLPPLDLRTQATTICLWTSKPAQQG